MHPQSPFNQLGYYTRSFGWVQPKFENNLQLDILNSSLRKEKYKNLDTDVILLRKPKINAVETKYLFYMNYAIGEFGLAPFDEDEWTTIQWLKDNYPVPGGSIQSPMSSFLAAYGANVPCVIEYANEAIEKRKKVSVKLKRINFDQLNFPSGLSLLEEFVEYIKNGNVRNYDDGDFISSLNEAIISEITLPEINAEIMIDDDIVVEKLYEQSISHIEPNDTTILVSAISQSIVKIGASFYKPAEMALNALLAVGDLADEIIDMENMELLNGNEALPAGKITEFKVTKSADSILLTNLDGISLYSSEDDIRILANYRLGSEVIESETIFIKEPQVALSDFLISTTAGQFGADMTRFLIKNADITTTEFFNKLYPKNTAQELGYNGFIFAGDEIDMEEETIFHQKCNYKNYTHSLTDPFIDRIYCQYKFNLNLHNLVKKFSEPGEPGSWVDEEVFNSIWIDDMPFGFYITSPSEAGDWYYTRYATDLPYTAPEL